MRATNSVAEVNEILNIMIEAELYVKYQSYSKAIELLTDVTERFPRYLPAKKALEDVLRRTGKFEEANEIAREVTVISAQLATEHAPLQDSQDVSAQTQKRQLVEKIDGMIRSIYESTEYTDILKTSAQQILENLPGDRCVIINFGQDTPAAKYFEMTGPGVPSCRANKTAKLNFLLRKRISGSLEPVAIDESTKDSGLVECREVLEEFAIRAIIACPLFYKSELIGILVAHRSTKGVSWTDQEKALFSTVAGHIAVAISNARQFSAMQTLAVTDKLTNLYNRRFFEERMLVELSNARHQKYPLSIALLDIDHFKRINDTFGHPAGDRVLCKLGLALTTNLRRGTVVARFGGEEFVVILPGCSVEVAHQIMDGIRRLIAETFAAEDGQPITLSVGVHQAFLAASSDLALVRKEAIQKADDLLYLAKRSGRNRVCSEVNAEG